MTTATPSRRLRRVDDARLTELARGIVRGDYLIVDDNPSWAISLALFATEVARVRNLGLMLVPVAPHMRGYWLNGTVPGVTLEVVFVAKGDVPALQSKVNTMNAALYPDAG